ncbi:ndufa2, NADH:ubiquinone oxidoreductase 10.5kD subunit [Mortierella alpina]|nr:ndufa2, NADH:ubiquinone oxidoreductase 10.5kD subunit [Mortierella alpina]
MSAFTKSLKELRVHFCQTSPASNGIRQFVASNYTAVKAANPNLPILIREAKGAEAKIFARFGKSYTSAEFPLLLDTGLFHLAVDHSITQDQKQACVVEDIRGNHNQEIVLEVKEKETVDRTQDGTLDIRNQHGQEKKIVLDGLSAKEIEQKLATLVK